MHIAFQFALYQERRGLSMSSFEGSTLVLIGLRSLEMVG